MADKNNTFVDVPDDSTNQVKLPEYAMESTQQQLIKLTEALVGSNDKSRALYQELIKETSKNAKSDKKSDKEADNDRNKQLDLLRDIQESSEKTAESTSKFGIGLGGIGTVVGVAVGAIATLAGTLFGASRRLGDYNQKLANAGVGFDDADMTLNSLTSSLQAMGMSIDRIEPLLTDFSGAVTVAGKKTFLQIQDDFAKITSSGTKFGLTMDEASTIVAEDLELRQQLGILDGINSNKAAQRSRELYQMQLEATTVLGKSIDEIRQSSVNTLADNAQVQLKLLGISKRFTADVGSKFLNSVTAMTSRLSSIGLDDQLIAQMSNEMFDAVAFMSGGGQELYAALTATGTREAQAIADSIRNINKAIDVGDIGTAERIMAQFPDQLMRMAKGMDQTQLAGMSRLLSALPGSLGQNLAIALGQLNTASGRAAKSMDEFPEMARQIAVFDQAVNTLKGQVGSVVTVLSAELAKPMAGLVQAFDDVTIAGVKQTGIFSSLRSAVESIKKTILDVFGNKGDMSDSTRNFASIIRTQVSPAITNLANWVNEKIINGFSNFDLSAWFTETKDKLAVFMSDASVFGKAIGNLGRLINRVFGRFFDNEPAQASKINELTQKNTTLGSERRAEARKLQSSIYSPEERAAIQENINNIDKRLVKNQESLKTLKEAADNSLNLTTAAVTTAGTLVAAAGAKTALAVKGSAAIIGETKNIVTGTTKVTTGMLNASKVIAGTAATGASAILATGLVLKDVMDVVTGSDGGANAENVGALIGTGIGVAIGATLGSVVPVVGTAFGAAAGASLGNMAGETIGQWIDTQPGSRKQVDRRGRPIKQQDSVVVVAGTNKFVDQEAKPGIVPQLTSSGRRTPTPATRETAAPQTVLAEQPDAPGSTPPDRTNENMLLLLNEVAANTKDTSKKLRELVDQSR